MDFKKISIIVQARSTSTRFPGKIFEKIGSKPILQFVLDACDNSATFINGHTNRHRMMCSVALAVPVKDMLIPYFSRHTVIEGPEDDVLTRYQMASDELQSDFVVRVTSDCPFIPPKVISRAISFAGQDNLDFVTNADPRYRTAPDGFDVEVMSKRLLSWLSEQASDPSDREHVTQYLLKEMPPWASRGDMFDPLDFYIPENKFSIDTKEDLERMRNMYFKISTARRMVQKPLFL